MGTVDGQFASSDGARGLCTRCKRSCPPNALSCSSCDAALSSETGGATIVADVDESETLLLDERAARSQLPQTDTVLDGEMFPSEPPPNVVEPSLRAAPSSAPEPVTVPRRKNVANPGPASAPESGISSDPPTRFLRGIDQHIELPSGSMVDDHEIDAKLGAGAMGVVYSARHVKVGRRVAIKVIAPEMGADPQALARFEREARTLASLHHPNIVDVYALGTLPDKRAYFVMEFLSGGTLYERLQRGRLPFDEALDILDQMARALEAAHGAGIVHRDLKPENTFLQRVSGEQYAIVKLLDFGLIRLAVSDGVESTASGAVIGTALYLSPEQARGPNVDGRTDIYALGVVAYEVVLGRHPFPDALTPTAALAAHLTELPPQPRTIWPEIPPALDLLMLAMLAKDPNYRPTLPQIRSVLESLRSPVTRRAETAPIRPRPTNRRTVAIAAVAMLIGIGIGAAVLGSRSSDERPMGVAPRDPSDASVPMATVLADTAGASIHVESDALVVIDAGDVQPSRPHQTIDAGAPVPNDASIDAAAIADAVPADAAVSPPPPLLRPSPPVSGFLKIVPPQRARVLVDGAAPVGALSRLPLTPGKHKVQFILGSDKYSFLVTIEPNQVVTLDKRDLYQPVPGPGSSDRNRTVNPFGRKPATK